MRTAPMVALLGLMFAQPTGDAYVGTWTAELAGTTYARLEFNPKSGGLEGRISLGDIRLDAQGEVSEAKDAPDVLTTIFAVGLSDAKLSFSRTNGDDVERFEMRLVGGSVAELLFLPEVADLKELAAMGIPAPKPFRLMKVVR